MCECLVVHDCYVVTYPYVVSNIGDGDNSVSGQQVIFSHLLSQSNGAECVQVTEYNFPLSSTHPHNESLLGIGLQNLLLTAKFEKCHLFVCFCFVCFCLR